MGVFMIENIAFKWASIHVWEHQNLVGNVDRQKDIVLSLNTFNIMIK